MPPAEFPLPPISAANPIPLYFEKLPEEFVVGRTIYDDNGADYKLQSGGAGVRRWVIKYEGLTAAQAAILDSWAASMFYSEDGGSAAGSNFRHHIAGDPWSSTAGTLYSNVHISPGGYQVSHTKALILAREFTLEQRP